MEIEKILNEVFKPFPEDIKKGLKEKFLELYKTPFTNVVELILGKRMTDDEVRHLLFDPLPKQYKYYVKLIQSPNETNAPVDQLKVQKYSLVLFYLYHVQNWSFITNFIEHGGLQVLVDMFIHPDLQIRGQVIESFMSITSHPDFEWFDTPKTSIGRTVHKQLLQVTGLVSNLITNREEGYPGGSLAALQILAFWLSWVRKLYSKDTQLCLNADLLNELSRWSTKETETEEEHELARKVFEDFNRFKQPIETADERYEKASKAMIALDFDTVIKDCTTALGIDSCHQSSRTLRAKALLDRNLDEKDLINCINDIDESPTLDEDLLCCKIKALGLLHRTQEILELEPVLLGDKAKKLFDIQRAIHFNSGKSINTKTEQHGNKVLQALLRRGDPTLIPPTSSNETSSVKNVPSTKAAGVTPTKRKKKTIVAQCIRKRKELPALYAVLSTYSIEEMKTQLEGSLSDQILIILLDVIEQHYQDRRAIDLLLALSQLSQFEFTLSVLPSKQQEQIRRIFQNLEKTHDIDALHKIYKL